MKLTKEDFDKLSPQMKIRLNSYLANHKTSAMALAVLGITSLFFSIAFLPLDNIAKAGIYLGMFIVFTIAFSYSMSKINMEIENSAFKIEVKPRNGK